MDLDLTAKFIRGFADKTRLQILHSIMTEEKTVSQIIEDIKIPQSRVSQHLGCLRDCGIVESRQEGKYVYYSVKNNHIVSLLNMFETALQPLESLVACCQTVEILTVPDHDIQEKERQQRT